MAITCCKECVAPKRYPGCHGSCVEYIEARAEYDRLKAINDQKKDVGIAIHIARTDKVYRAMKDRRTK